MTAQIKLSLPESQRCHCVSLTQMLGSQKSYRVEISPAKWDHRNHKKIIRIINSFHVEDLILLCHCRHKIKKKYLMENFACTERYLKDDGSCQSWTYRLLDTCCILQLAHYSSQLKSRMFLKCSRNYSPSFNQAGWSKDCCSFCDQTSKAEKNLCFQESPTKFLSQMVK